MIRRMRWLLFGLLAVGGCAGSSFEVAASGDGGTDTRTATDTGTAPDTTTADSGTTPSDSGVGVDGGSSDAGGCTKNSDCASTSYCVLCGGVSKGTCKPKPTLTTGFQPVCGCDGITYWNSDFAVFYGVDIVANVPCTLTATKCGASASCPGGTNCVQARELATGCALSDGTCWRTSRSGTVGDCSTGFNPKVRYCGETTCSNACQAILAGKEFYADPTCP